MSLSGFRVQGRTARIPALLTKTSIFLLLARKDSLKALTDAMLDTSTACRYTCVAVCCSVLQCVAVCCSVLRCLIRRLHVGTPVLQCVAVCYSVLQCVEVCCTVWQCVAVRCDA